MTATPYAARRPVPAPRTLRLVAEPSRPAVPRGAARAARPAWFDRLSRRESEVLWCIAQGRSNAEIAADLFISVPTVKSHVARLLTKVHARDRVQLVVAAYRSGFVPVSAHVEN
ncbi:helix-turn-helix transcriptional regulator [Nocardioides sp. TF02-7]|uniref:response regulator transcription factor n=1 Tax=Nocardioides sp. TF02-7 TaxID=2917724 RepID=UPI001F068AAA|nr:helix-turn-helix transcriptional regulator [Nocardioides sp. TF02-7]UMG92826.1 helix-turn-helix transcriptional regulator [Nocardioides sp. TF02-7]